MKSKSRNGQRHNALKLGAFAKELVILDENKNDFDELHNSCIKELKPAGGMEEEVVLAIAKYMWRKRRIERLFVEEADWLRDHPEMDDLRTLSWVDAFIQKGVPCKDVLRYLGFLPEKYVKAIQSEISPPPSDYDDEWIDQVKKTLDWFRFVVAHSVNQMCSESRFIGETAAKIRELSVKQTALEDRLDMMIDKALKRLANLKAFKEVMAVQETGQPRQISRGR